MNIRRYLSALVLYRQRQHTGGPRAADRAVSHSDQPDSGPLRRADRRQHQRRLRLAGHACRSGSASACPARCSLISVIRMIYWVKLGRSCRRPSRRSSISPRPASWLARSTPLLGLDAGAVRQRRRGLTRAAGAAGVPGFGRKRLLPWQFPERRPAHAADLGASDLAAAADLGRSAARLHRHQSLHAGGAADPDDQHQLRRPGESRRLARDLPPKASARETPRRPPLRNKRRRARSPTASIPRSTTCRRGFASSTASSG